MEVLSTIFIEDFQIFLSSYFDFYIKDFIYSNFLLLFNICILIKLSMRILILNRPDEHVFC